MTAGGTIADQSAWPKGVGFICEPRPRLVTIRHRPTYRTTLAVWRLRRRRPARSAAGRPPNLPTTSDPHAVRDRQPADRWRCLDRAARRTPRPRLSLIHISEPTR